MAAIEETGYKSNFAAASLAGGAPRLVTMMISNLFTEPSSRIIGELVNGVVDGVSECGFHSVIWPMSEEGESDANLLLKSNFSGGVVLMNVQESDERVRLLHKAKVPFVVLGRTNVGFKYNFVDRDFEERDRIALTTLKELGHSNIGVITFGDIIRPNLKKLAKELKLNISPISTVNTYEGGIEVAKVFKSKYSKISAVISVLDAATIGFVESASEYQISIPGDVSVLGLNMLESQAESSTPKISTIAFDAYDLAKACGKMIVEVIENGDTKKVHKSQLWAGDYVDRGTVAKAAKRSAR